ncbi:thiamine ABC transporter, ATP-binding protein, putative [Fulvimarina pelagi HTCC2506]|uniref:Thiamine ABC transporter, ATP-binding protein, putative n=1 Tax=Fulvimarina pelagi HTCC2506 TaxID=314231 RepID=Q0G294_9HYPH|nr:ATP-binding cassette domain-containing protein [Fulvimarina pelagi]EAU41304.1 thiamine ABC transporter, ATP-binding protein, putative [Fulvimarina pelagi HTCC2506]
MSDPRPALKLDQAVFARDDWSVTLDLELMPGEWLALIGPSGAGKSTLMDMVAGFLPLTSGSISIAEEDVSGKGPSERPLSIVFQDNNLFPHLTVFQNVALGIAPNRRVAPHERGRIENILDTVGLGGKGGRKPHELSGGERQRAALARAFLRRQPLLLLDEPFASLGPALRRDMMKTLRQLRSEFTETPLTILMVTHHPEDARSYADRVAFLDQGRIAHVGPVENMLGEAAPEDVRRYLGSQDHSRRLDAI